MMRITGRTPGAAALEVSDRLYAALAVLRAVLLVHTVVMTVVWWDDYDRRWAVGAVVAAAVVWSGLVTWAYARASRRHTWLVVADVVFAMVSLVLGPLIKGADFNASILGFWIVAPILAAAVRWHTLGGLVSALSVGFVDLAVRSSTSSNEWGNVVLLVVTGVVVGYLTGSVQRMAEDRAAAERAAAIATERTRLARAVHDGVLQVLALVQRRGAEQADTAVPAADWQELGRMAGEQEASLRAMIRQQDALPRAPRLRGARPYAPGWFTRAQGSTGPGDGTPQRIAGSTPTGTTGTSRTSGSADTAPSTPLDLTTALEAFSSATVTVAGPGQPVLLPRAAAEELLAVVGECLTNVRTHVGARAPAWVLLEDTGDAVVVGVRDEGPGIAPDRLEAAAREGRMGVVSSIRGRIDDLGGTAHLDTGPYGTEWEFTVPQERHA